MRLKYYSCLIVIIVSIWFLISGCKKLVEVPDPVDTITDEAAYSTDATAASILNGIYINMGIASSGGFSGLQGISVVSGLSSDELHLNYLGERPYSQFFQNSLGNVDAGTVTLGSENWKPLYKYIYICNAAIEGINRSKTLSVSAKQQLLGEAKFMRAFFYFYLVNLFGDVPLAITTDYKINSLLYRSPVAQVYQLIVTDLKDANELLSDKYLNGTVNGITSERVRPTRWAASALLARVYLYIGEPLNAEALSTLVINNNSMFTLPSLNNAFLKNSSEAIWQLQPTNSFFNTDDAIAFVIPATGFSSANPLSLSANLMNAFEINDLRKQDGNWVNSVNLSGTTYYYPYKYKANTFDPNIIPSTGSQNMTEYLMVLRLGEQFLIRAEARAKQNNLAGAIEDLDKIRKRAGLPLIANTNPGISQSTLLDVIFHERQVELFSEWGHRWFDLKRTGRVDAVMNLITPLKNGNWESYDALYPLPLGELQKAPNLIQNPGYN